MTNILVYVSEVNFLFVLWISMSQLWVNLLIVFTSGLADEVALIWYIGDGYGRGKVENMKHGGPRVQDEMLHLEVVHGTLLIVPWPGLITGPHCGIGSSVLPDAKEKES